MIIVNGVRSTTKPVEIDDFSSETTVFVRSDIHEITDIDPVFNTEQKYFEYTETSYTFQEWSKKLTDGIKIVGEELQAEIDITQLALIEILQMMGIASARTMSLSLDEEKEYSAIVKLYANMIDKKLIIINDVPEAYRQEVEEYMKDEVEK